MLEGKGSPPLPFLHFGLVLFLVLPGKVSSRREQGAGLALFWVLHGASGRRQRARDLSAFSHPPVPCKWRKLS